MQRRILLALALLSLSSHTWSDDAIEAEALLAAGQFEQALTQLDSQLITHPDDPQALFLRALALEKLGQVSGAVEMYQRLIDAQPLLPEPYNNLAVIYARQGNFSQAEQTLQAAIKTHFSYATAHNNLSEIYKTLASIAYNKALNLNNGQPKADRVNLQSIETLRSSVSPSVHDSEQVASACIEAVSVPETVVMAEPQPAPGVDNLALADTHGAPNSDSNPPSVAPIVTTPRVPMPVEEVAAAPLAVAAAPPATPTTAAEECLPVPDDATHPEEKDSKPAKTVDTKMVDIRDVEKSVMDWAQAWSAQDVSRYLNSYSAAFNPPDGLARQDWEAQRNDRLRAPAFIRINISQLRSTVLNNEYVSVIFTQRYQSNKLKAITTKLLILTYEDEQWRILQETEIN